MSHKWQWRHFVPFSQPCGLQNQAQGLHWPASWRADPKDISGCRAAMGMMTLVVVAPPRSTACSEALSCAAACGPALGCEGAGGCCSCCASRSSCCFVTGPKQAACALKTWPRDGNWYCTRKLCGVPSMAAAGATASTKGDGPPCDSTILTAGQLLVATIGGAPSASSSLSLTNPSMKVFFTLTVEGMCSVRCLSNELELELPCESRASKSSGPSSRVS
mmetsp:Transcript_15133/g.40837  ORF Transcript_15133/g.40837 Transcript_15133/m.40837 type:complete len:219 (-) Transcript_15133:85-741(-)